MAGQAGYQIFTTLWDVAKLVLVDTFVQFWTFQGLVRASAHPEKILKIFKVFFKSGLEIAFRIRNFLGGRRAG